MNSFEVSSPCEYIFFSSIIFKFHVNLDHSQSFSILCLKNSHSQAGSEYVNQQL